MLLTRLWCLVFLPRIIALKPKVIEQSDRKGFEYESTSILITRGFEKKKQKQKQNKKQKTKKQRTIWHIIC